MNRGRRGSQRERLLRGAFLAGLALVVIGNGLGFATDRFVRSLGPPEFGETIAWSPMVVDKDGRLLRPFTTAGGVWRLPARPADVDPRFLAALVAYEDKRFHSHGGVDPIALTRAALQSLRAGRVVSGGSTLTMQVARLLEPRPARRLRDKAAEIVRAVQLESRLSKDEILSLYLALAPYGGNLEGVRAASLAYFGKEPRRLSTAESAFLVALPQSPETRRPDRDAAAAARARDRVLAQLVARGAISADQALAARGETPPAGRLGFPMLAAHVAERLARAAPDGAVVITTLERPLQDTLERLARERAIAAGGGLAVALLAVDNASGRVRAHVGGVGFFDAERAGQVDLARALRSPGSTLKPFIYALAFEDGRAHPETLIDDTPVRFGSYAPENFDDEFHGTVTVRRALQLSLNVPAVRLLEAVGAPRLMARLQSAGAAPVVARNAAPGLAVGLGGAGTRLVDLAALYVALARGGEAVPLIWRADERETAPPRRLFDAPAAFMVADVLRGAPPPRNAPGGVIAYKTGTSYGYRDAWAVGFDGATTIAVWMGRPDGAAVPGLVGRDSAAPILFDAFQRLQEPRAPFAPAPRGTLLARTTDLPVALQRFRPDALPDVASAAPSGPALALAWPPDGARLETTPGGLVVKAAGGQPPYTFMVDGVPIEIASRRREAIWRDVQQGFARVSVIDRLGASASARVQVD